ncbi:hypothetical protein [Rhizobium sp. AAP43]|uniref:hypothetical protein n=1 Tax=Rhizobium sp. AAP43 TaxID=1523420 RepID=UPI0006B8E433|nr:hypothetical protein [Rhizobium sp. AAP43]KPF41592.1 hypothetical protein IP76_20295 [Rhizobium sp. AAP43]
MQDSYAIIAIISLQQAFPRNQRMSEDEFYRQHASSGVLEFWRRVKTRIFNARTRKTQSAAPLTMPKPLSVGHVTNEETRCTAPGLAACH